MSKVFHISKVSRKDAKTLAVELSKVSRGGMVDSYNCAIVGAALALIAQDKEGWVYHTQYTSGATMWFSPVKGNGTIIVTHEQASKMLQ
jgi:hypothetical protein